MAKVDPNWTIKSYPQELQVRLDAMMEETKSTRQALDNLDRDIQGATSVEDFKNIAKLAIGNGNYLRKKLGKLVSTVKNVKSNRYLEIKLECAQKGMDFVSTVATEEASAYVGPLRTVRDILEAYVVSADNIISICRMNVNDQRQFQSTASVEASA